MSGGPRFTVCTRATPAALGVLHLHADDEGSLDRALERMGLGPVRDGSIALRDLLRIDRGVVMRVGPRAAMLVPHGGVQVVRALRLALLQAGLLEVAWHGEALPEEGADSIGGVLAWEQASALHPEARDEVEARALLALSRCPSPLGVDLLLAQRQSWARAGGLALARTDPALDRARHRLLVPPIVAGVGRANIGKSTLLNTLAGRHVAQTGNEAGTTRDHVGVALELDGLVVRYLDLPGLRENAESVERKAIAIALRAIARADLLVIFGDVTAPPVTIEGDADRLMVALRSDLGHAGYACDLRVSARTGEGLQELPRMIRRRLVPDAALADPTPWAFWQPTA